MTFIASLLIGLLYAFIIVLFVRVAISWVSPYPRDYGREPGWRAVGAVARFAFRITEPFLAPVRRWVPPVSGIDLSPLVVMLVAYFIIAALRTI